MKRILILMLIGLICLTAACGKTDATDSAAQTPVSLGAVMEEILNSVPTPEMMTLDADDLTEYFGVDPEWYTEEAVCINANGFEKEEIALFRAASDADARRIVDCLQTALENAAAETQNYLPEQYAMIRNSEVRTKGLYVWLFISDAGAQMQTILDNYIQ